VADLRTIKEKWVGSHYNVRQANIALELSGGGMRREVRQLVEKRNKGEKRDPRYPRRTRRRGRSGSTAERNPSLKAAKRENGKEKKVMRGNRAVTSLPNVWRRPGSFNGQRILDAN